MCGIFGLVTDGDSRRAEGFVEHITKDLFRLSETRGKEASGLAARSNGTIHLVRKPLPASKLLRHEDFERLMAALRAGDGPLALVGHARLVTHGNQILPENNQPVFSQDLLCVHNGIVVNHERLWRESPHLHRAYEVDTEIIPGLVGDHLNRGYEIHEALSHTLGRIEGTASVALLSRRLEILALATNNGSLYLGRSDSWPGVVFASEEFILRQLAELRSVRTALGPLRVQRIEPNRGCIVDSGTLEVFEFSARDKKSLPWRPRNHDAGVVEYGETPSVTARNSDIYSSGLETNVEAFARRMVGVDVPFPPVSEKTGRSPVDLRRCSKCVLPETVPFIDFDDDGVCRYCRVYRRIEVKGPELLAERAAGMRASSGDFDCIVALSGGRDSCYVLHYVRRELGLNPVAYTFDWGVITDLARRNQARMCGKLGVEHILVSADITRKRLNIKRNVEAWLRKPVLGMVPLFMAGDKEYFAHARDLMNRLGTEVLFFGVNELENEDFKEGFCGVATEKFHPDRNYGLGWSNKLRMAGFYGWNFLANPGYLNSSLVDTARGAYYYYMMSHEFFVNLFAYVPWIEEEVVGTLRTEYDWEISGDTHTTWRIGDGTAAFYNYIYYTIAGFGENDSFRSNQVREGLLEREEALRLARLENEPRYPSIYEYCRMIGLDFRHVVETVNGADKLY